MRMVVLGLCMSQLAWGQDTIEVETWPSGAEVRQILDNKKESAVVRGVTPCKVVVMSQGKINQAEDYALQFSLAGHRDVQRIIPHSFVNGKYDQVIRLTPDNAWIGFKDQLRGHWLHLLIVGSGLGGGIWWTRRHRSAKLQQVEQRVEQLEQKVADETLIGSTLGGYKLIRHLGTGGAADVFLGENAHEQVAVKVLRSDSMEELGRFKREVEIARSLRHPNILLLYGYGEERGRLFLVLELMPGGTLRSKLQGIEPAEARQWLRSLFAATAHAHEQGVVHRDLKPENVMLTAAGVLKIADFGLAKAPASNTVTQDGSILGTPAYMSPDQIDGTSRDPRIDQYSLGVMTFEILMGRLPFVDENPLKVLYQHLHEAPPPLTPTFSPAVEAVVHRMLAKQPELRFPSVAEAWQALNEALA